MVDYECESDEMADSLRLERSPLTKPAHTNRRETSLFIFGEDTPPTPVISPMPSLAQSSVRGKHDDVSHRGRFKSDTPASVGISGKGDSSIPASVNTTEAGILSSPFPLIPTEAGVSRLALPR